MKKTYNAPKTIICDIQLTHIMAGSDIPTGSYTGGPIDTKEREQSDYSGSMGSLW